jgi:hypothetical protein
MSEKIPILWGKFFYLTDKVYLAKLVYSLENSYFKRKFERIVNDFSPNVIISVYPFWHAFVKSYKKNNKNLKY